MHGSQASTLVRKSQITGALLFRYHRDTSWLIQEDKGKPTQSRAMGVASSQCVLLALHSQPPPGPSCVAVFRLVPCFHSFLSTLVLGSWLGFCLIINMLAEAHFFRSNAPPLTAITSSVPLPINLSQPLIIDTPTSEDI